MAEFARLRRDAHCGASPAADRLFVTEPPRNTPVVAEVDVLVAGGGPAGVGAALAAAREGASVLIIERFGMLGGMWTAGLLNPFFEFDRNGWIVRDIVESLKSANAWREWTCGPTFDNEEMKLLLERKMLEANAAFWYYSFVTDVIADENGVCGLIVEGKSGREAVLAKVIIDCTGDGDVAARAGAAYEMGRISDGGVQPLTLMFTVDGINYTQTSAVELYDLMTEAISAHHLDIKLPFGRVDNVPWIITTPGSGTAAVELSHVYQMNPVDTRDLTWATTDARRQVHEAIDVFRHIPGFSNVRLTQTASTIGVRETRRVLGEYILSLDDLIAGRRFDDAVAFCGFCVDIHAISQEEGRPGIAVQPYEIPYRCLLPKDISGLLVAGRCISGTHEAHASYRVTGTCMAMGQAAGLAAAMSIRQDCAPSELDGNDLRKQLIERGVPLHS